MKQKYLLLFFFVLLISNVYSLALSGDKLVHQIDYETGYVREDTYTVRNAEGFTSDYIFDSQYVKGQDLGPYMTFVPERVSGVEHGGNRQFTVRLELPDDFEIAGESETWAKVKIDQDAVNSYYTQKVAIADTKMSDYGKLMKMAALSKAQQKG